MALDTSVMDRMTIAEAYAECDGYAHPAHP